MDVPPYLDIHKIVLDIESFKNRLNTKDLEIEILNEEVRTGFEIKSLQS